MVALEHSHSAHCSSKGKKEAQSSSVRGKIPNYTEKEPADTAKNPPSMPWSGLIPESYLGFTLVI